PSSEQATRPSARTPAENSAADFLISDMTDPFGCVFYVATLDTGIPVVAADVCVDGLRRRPRSLAQREPWYCEEFPRAAVILSSKPARKTTARPASTPWARSRVEIAETTSWPSPGAPTMPAITAMDSEGMITWLTPAMIDGTASGSWMPRRICQSLAPNASPASTVSESTCRMPSSVSRTPGGSAKMMVENSPGTTPID